MKLLMIIVNEEYQRLISSIFEQRGCNATIIASTGDFLQYGDTIFLSGVDDQGADELIGEIRKQMGVVNGGQSNAIDEQNRDVTVFSIDIFQYVKCGGQLPYERGKKESIEFSFEKSIR